MRDMQFIGPFLMKSNQVVKHPSKSPLLSVYCGNSVAITLPPAAGFLAQPVKKEMNVIFMPDLSCVGAS